MSYYPCFISFRHFGDAISEAFIKQFFECLKGYLNPLVGKEPFIDFERMQPGYSLKPAIADALCKSACMIVIWSPQYFNEEQIWCAMEYKAMKELEKKRLGLLPNTENYKKLIIPVIYRGSKYYPSNLSQETLYLNLEKFALYEPPMAENKNFAAEIEKLANYIYERIAVLKTLNNNQFGNCGDFGLPTNADTLQFIQRLNQNIDEQEFPFRES